jgi:tetratricopeptide (TPR) repeat protein
LNIVYKYAEYKIFEETQCEQNNDYNLRFERVMILNYHLHFKHAIELTVQNKYQEAIEELTKGLELNPKHFASLLNRGTIYSLLQLWPFAI